MWPSTRQVPDEVACGEKRGAPLGQRFDLLDDFAAAV
jgi:hypothetical protein